MSCPLPGGSTADPFHLLHSTYVSSRRHLASLIIGDEASCRRRSKGRGRREAVGRSAAMKIKFRKEPSGLMVLLSQPGGLKPGAGQRGLPTGNPGVRDTAPAHIQLGASSKTPTNHFPLLHRGLLGLPNTELVGHVMVTTLNSSYASPSLWSIINPAFSAPQKAVHVVTQRCILECSQQC